jgi:putative PIN family toxin of toxin-antitoxin system
MTEATKEKPRLVIDSNVLIPILTYKYPNTNWLVQTWQQRLITPLVNQETLDELEAKLREKSPTSREYPAQRFVETALRQYERWCEFIPLMDNTNNPKCNDPTDQKFIDLAFAGNADHLITRDHALLRMAPVVPFHILEVQDFRKLLLPHHSRSD